MDANTAGPQKTFASSAMIIAIASNAWSQTCQVPGWVQVVGTSGSVYGERATDVTLVDK